MDGLTLYVEADANIDFQEFNKSANDLSTDRRN